jgi:hypothetical protein
LLLPQPASISAPAIASKQTRHFLYFIADLTSYCKKSV